MKTKTILLCLLTILIVTPLTAQQTVQESDNFEPIQTTRISKNTSTDTYSTDAGGYFHIGRGIFDTDQLIYRTYYSFDLSKIAAKHNVSIDEVKLDYSTGNKSGTFKVTGPSSISGQNIETHWNAIGNASSKESGISYGDNEIISTGLKSYVEAQLFEDYLIVGALSEEEGEDDTLSISTLDIELEITYTYEAYPIIVRNDFNGLSGGNIGVGKNATAVSRSSPYTVTAINGDKINLEAYDNQNINGYTWVFNDTEDPENNSRWAINKSGNITTISSNQSTSRTANDDQNAIIFNEQKRVFSINRNDYSPELGSNFNSANVEVVEENELTAPSIQTKNGITYQFIDWSDGETDNPRTIYSPTTSLTAQYKGFQISNKSTAFKANQRNYVRSKDGWEHMVYESLGHIWYEAKSPTGDWELIGRGNRPHLDQNGGKSPSIDFNTEEFPWDDMVIISWQEGTKIHVQVFRYLSGSDAYSSAAPYIDFSTGQSAGYNTQPNVVWSDKDDFIVFWKSSSGIKYRIYDFSGTGGAIEKITPDEVLISGTSGAYNIAATSFTDGNNIYFDLAWQTSHSASPPYYIATKIWFTSLKYNVLTQSVTPVGSPKQVSSGAYYRNKEPSITSIGTFDKVIGYISGSTTNSLWDPWNTWATTARVQNGMFGWQVTSRTNKDHHVRSVSVNKQSNNSEYYTAWSQIYDQQGYTDYNKFVEGSAPGTFKTLNTKGWDVQLTQAGAAGDIHAFSYYPKTQPYYWLRSNSLGSYLKAAPFMASQQRGVVLSDSAQTTGFYYGIGDIFVEGKPVGFVPIKQQEIPEEAVRRDEGRPISQSRLETVLPLLRTAPFQAPEEEITFEETFLVGDSASAFELLGRNGFISIKTKLVDAINGTILAVLQEQTISVKDGISRKEKAWKVNLSRFAEKTVQIQLAVETNLPGLIAEVEDTYTDDYARGKVIPQEYEELEPAVLQEINAYQLAQNYPNPFNPSTMISYQLPVNSDVRLEVFDLLGRSVATLVNEQQSTGRYNITFDASHLASGVYLYRLTAGEFTQSKKLFLIK
ncbi:MAG: T9SS type A sorting domain-containing protein [Balneolaceae bacterium]